MPASNTFTGLPNADVYLNHLSPPDAKQLEISRNIILGVLGATVWDILTYVSDDIEIMRGGKFDLVMFCFAFSRLSAVIYVFINGIGRVLPINDPHAIATASACFCMLSMITSSYLFLRRVEALYLEQKWVRWTFFLLWVIFSVADILIPLGVNATLIPGTHYYLDARIPPYVALSPFTPLFFDTSVLLAISYKVASMHNGDPRISWYTSVSGGTLPRLPRAILRGGQQYYLITVGLTALVGITLCLPSVPQILKSSFPLAMVPLMASMASRVYRNTKLFDLNPAFTETRFPNIPVSTVRPSST